MNPLSALTPGREQARGWAVEELSRREYAAQRPGLLTRAIEQALEWLRNLDLPSGTGTSVLLTVVLVALVVLAAVAVQRTGGVRRQARADAAGQVFPDRRLSSAEHRAAADSHAAAGDFAAAVRERFRAVARDLEERAVLTDLPGRTAHEIAGDAGRELPGLAEPIATGAAMFDAVVYGGAPASAEDDALLRRLDERVRPAYPSSR